jgi:hypothetical protein
MVSKTTNPPTQYRLTIFLGAFLLFAVQLLLAKYFLPWFGGAPAVWTTCMFFFQMLLLAGYAYAHGLANWFSPRLQSALHFSLLFASLVLLVCLAFAWPSPLTPDGGWKPQGAEQTTWSLIVLLAVSVGLPYFVLSTTAPLLQAWFARTQPRETPYRLYAVSNLGSFLALLSYPFLVEPWLTLKMQARLWSLGFLGYAIGCGYCALQAGRNKTWEGMSSLPDGNGEAGRGGFAEQNKPGLGSYTLWLSLTACGSIMFLASTNQICQDIAAVPLLWILPLSLYLLSFVICFEKPDWYSRGAFHLAFGLALYAACYVLKGGASGSIVIQVAAYSLSLFTACMVCHGELYRSKPGPCFLTSFYLIVALGGALGGIFVALIAPHLFKSFWEYQLGLWGSALLMFIILMRDKGSWLYCSRFGMASLAIGAAFLPACTALASPHKTGLSDLTPFVAALVAAILLARKSQTGFDAIRARAVPLYCGTALLVLGAVCFFIARSQAQGSILVVRNFYGVLTVREQNADRPDWRAYELIHGRVTHGFQFCSQAKRGLPTGYYGTTSGVGVALLHLHEAVAGSAGDRSLRIGIVGLGVGTLAAYAKAGDFVRFYEINPEVVRIARDTGYFTYVRNCPAKLDVIEGDARLSMEDELRRKEPQQFDLLAVDAFTGDAIPVHLLTQEAFRVYLNEIRKPNGVLAIHISNHYVDLNPVLMGIAEHFGLKYILIHTSGDGNVVNESFWGLLSQNGKFLDSLSSSKQSNSKEAHRPAVRLWTDDYSNLLQVLTW